MAESFEQFQARIHSPPKPLPVWVSALLFLAIFFVLQMAYGACRGTSVERFVIGDLTVAPAVSVIGLLTPEVAVEAHGNRLTAPGGGITVLKGCEGIEVMFMLAAAFFSVVMPWRQRLAGLAWGIVLVFCLNQVRLIGLFYAYRVDKPFFDLLHGTLAPTVLIILVAFYALYWFQKPIRPAEASLNAG